jgi:hypothetical protein
MATRSTDGRSRRSAKGTSEVEMEHLNSRGEKSEKDEEFDQDDDSEFDEVSDVVEFHPGEEKILVRKLDWRVVGLVALLYLLSFLDRSSKSPLLMNEKYVIIDRLCRYWKCQNSRLDGRSEIDQQSI